MPASVQSDGERKVAFVTGASYGIGAACALALADDGYDLALAATRVENLAKTVEQLKPCGRRVVAVALDLNAQSSIEQAMATVVGALGRVDVLVNNAAANLRKKAIDITLDEWNTSVNVNLTGTFFLTQQVGRHLIAEKRPGAIISITSVQGVIGADQRSVYGITKAGVMHMSRMLAIEWAEHGIRLNTVAPGRLDTESPSRKSTTGREPNYLTAMINKIPLHRLCTVDDVAAAVSYLASAQASYITGQSLILDGGLSVY
jgi:NAD(P)-dependent dehydrogenase (short-subunit alcohol dehydrogenase family)